MQFVTDIEVKNIFNTYTLVSLSINIMEYIEAIFTNLEPSYWIENLDTYQEPMRIQ